MTKLTFDATMRIIGANPYVLVSAARARAIKSDWRKPLPVLVRVNGAPKAKPWRINMMPTGKGSFYLYLHGEVRNASKTGVGDRVTIEVAFDAAYRGGPAAMPAWFAKPLRLNAVARAGYARLPPSRQKEIVRYLANLKSEAARERNIKRTLEVLGGSGGRHMARDW